MYVLAASPTPRVQRPNHWNLGSRAILQTVLAACARCLFMSVRTCRQAGWLGSTNSRCPASGLGEAGSTPRGSGRGVACAPDGTAPIAQTKATAIRRQRRILGSRRRHTLLGRLYTSAQGAARDQPPRALSERWA